MAKKRKVTVKNIDPLGSFVHSWIIPLLHAALWAAGLFFTLKPEEILPTYSFTDNGLEIIKFLAIFIVLFSEAMITLLDIYVTNRAVYLAPRFILFVVLLLMLVVATSVCAGFAFASEGRCLTPLFPVLAYSSLLKLIENLLTNNTRWYIVSRPTILNGRGIYISRVLA